MTKYCLTLVTIFITTWSLAQNGSNYWYFGKNAGIIFDSTGITPTSGQMFTAEGCASISDGCGLLFYTDGDTIWNKNHTMMANGFGLGGQCSAFGRQSATQPAIIVRQPKNDSIFYVFTTDCHEDELVNGLRYSIVNMARQNGHGEVILKNQYLHAKVSEKVTAAKHSNGCDVWIITHEYGTNGFYSYLLTDTALVPTPVISYAGQVHSGDTTYNNCVRGYLKASPNGEKLISVTPDGVYWYCDTILPELFSFNKTTGTVTSDVVLPGDTSVSGYYNSWAIPFYGATFSPDNSKLYVSSGFYGPHLFQYDLNAGTQLDIINSKTLLNTPSSGLPRPCAMQIGPDGKIYVAQRWKGYLGVINEPDSAGLACQYIDSAVALLPNTLQDWGGLPNFFDAYTIRSPLFASFNYATPIVGSPTLFTDNSTGANTYHWDFGDNQTSTLQNPVHVYADTGMFTVTLTVTDSLCNLDKYCTSLFVAEPNSIKQPSMYLPSANIYPNPFQMTTTIDLVNIENATIDILSIEGEQIQHVYNHGQSHLTIEMGQNLEAGIYLLRVLTDKATLTRKMIKIE